MKIIYTYERILFFVASVIEIELLIRKFENCYKFSFCILLYIDQQIIDHLFIINIELFNVSLLLLKLILVQFIYI